MLQHLHQTYSVFINFAFYAFLIDLFLFVSQRTLVIRLHQNICAQTRAQSFSKCNYGLFIVAMSVMLNYEIILYF